jgi:predicted nuclease of predicted toxin-antitoxin system
MKLLANENFPIKSVRFLQQSGYDIKAIGIDDPSISDVEVLKIAAEENRLILTFDRDYGTLIFKFNFRPVQGVIYLRLDEYDAEEPGRIIHKLLTEMAINTVNALTVYDGTVIRQRKY